MPFVTQRRVEFVDTDMAGIMHFSRFFIWMESVEVELMRSLGLSVVMEQEGQAIGFPRVAAQCTYKKPVRFENLVNCAITIAKMGVKSITYNHVFSFNDQRIAEGSIVTCCTEKTKDALQSIPIPDKIRVALLASTAAT